MFDSAFQDGVKRPGTREMTALLAGLMALNAFAIDAMIPALPDIGRSLHVAQENDRQLVVISYFLGFASTQLLWGPLADRFGRKPILACGVGLYGFFALLCAFAGSFPLLIAGRRRDGRLGRGHARAGGGDGPRPVRGGGDGPRDEPRVHGLHAGARCSRRTLASSILLFAPWRAIFVVLAGYALTMFAWSWIRLPETLHPEFRRALDWREMSSAFVQTIRDPLSRGYTLAMTVSFSGLDRLYLLDPADHLRCVP